MMELHGVTVPEGYNGIGLHDTPGAYTATWSYQEAFDHGRWLREQRGVTLYKLFVSGTNKIQRARGYVDAGLVVVIRMYINQPWGWPVLLAPLDQVAPYMDVGVQLVEQGNEFNIECEWRNGIPYNPATIAERVVTAWESLLGQQAQKPGMACLFPSNTPGGNVDHRLCYQAIRAELVNRGLLGTVKHVAVHPRPLNNPPDTTWSQDNTCTFDEWRWIRDTLKPDAYYWATEHGYALGDGQNPGYPPIDLQRHTDYNWELALRLNPAHAQAIEPQFAGYCHWFHAGYGHWGAWPRDSLVDSPDPAMPAPSPLWIRMGEQKGQLAFSRYTEEPPPPPPPEEVKGFDVSAAQVHINWWAGVNAGNKFAIIRSSTATAVDTGLLTRHLPESEGVPYIRFLYHALQPTMPADYQARLALGLARSFPVSGAAFDVEKAGLTLAMVKTFCETWWSMTPVPLGFYSNLAWIAKLKKMGDISFLSKCWLWLAQWGVEKPNVPSPWNTWTFWQWGKAVGPEYPYAIDRNLYNGSTDQLLQQFGFIPDWCGTQPPPPPPSPVRFTYTPGGTLILLWGNHPQPGTIVRLSNGPNGSGYVWQTMAGAKPEIGSGGYEFNVPTEGQYWLEHQNLWYEASLARGVTTAVYE